MNPLNLFNRNKEAEVRGSYTLEQMLSDIEQLEGNLWIKRLTELFNKGKRYWACDWDKTTDGVKLDIDGVHSDTLFEAVQSTYIKMRNMRLIK